MKTPASACSWRDALLCIMTIARCIDTALAVFFTQFLFDIIFDKEQYNCILRFCGAVIPRVCKVRVLLYLRPFWLIVIELAS